jgi:hypothetical protein
VVILTAASRNRHLARFVDKKELKMLFRSTVEFLDVIAPKSSAPAKDRNILVGLEKVLFGTPPGQGA